MRAYDYNNKCICRTHSGILEGIMYFLIPLCLCIAAVFIRQEKEKKYVNAVILKGLASLCFVIFGILASDGSQTAKMIVAGLILGCVADVFLNLRYVFEEKGKLIFLAGILIFLSGHIAYLAAIVPSVSSKLICLIAGIVITALLMKWIFTQITAAKAFKIFGIFYIGAIVLLNCYAFAALFENPGTYTSLFALGAFLFLISDIVLILNTFGSVSRFSLRIVNLSLYYIGQLLIAMSLLHM